MPTYKDSEEARFLIGQYVTATNEQGELLTTLMQRLNNNDISMREVADALEASRKKVESLYSALEMHRIA